LTAIAVFKASDGSLLTTAINYPSYDGFNCERKHL